MPDTTIAELVKAWAITMIAVTLLVAALALSQVWDTEVYLRALPDALALDV